MIWTCSDCGAKMKLARGITPSVCCVCQGKNLTSPESKERLETYSRYDNELEEIAQKLNCLKEQEKPLHDRYTYIMQYFRQQKRRNLISEEEYKSRAEKYEWLQKKRRN